MKKIKLRPNQQKAVDNLLACFLGQDIEPTGNGKSLIALECYRRIKEERKVSTWGVIFVHRILLAKQWIKIAARYLIGQHNMKLHFLNINSSKLSRKVTDDIEKCMYDAFGPGAPGILSTTNPDDVRTRLQTLTEKGYSVIVVCTYHSAEVLEKAKVNFNLKIFDEAHTIVGNKEFQHCHNIHGDKSYFFTATPRHTSSDNGAGMNNESIYGPVVHSVSPKEAIRDGTIVAPMVHVIGTEWNPKQEGPIGERDYDAYVSMIYYAHGQHEIEIKRRSVEPNNIGAKMLVPCPGQLTLQGIFESALFKRMRQERPHIKVYGLSSDFGIYNDGVYNQKADNSGKEDLLYALYDLKSSDSAIILHVDMLSEGIDVPGITSMMPLRNFAKDDKFMQNFGRATRLHPVDAERIENGELKLGDWAEYIKPNCHVVLPYCLSESNDFVDRYAMILHVLKEDYGFDPAQHMVVDILCPAVKPPQWDEDMLRKQIRGKVRDDIIGFYYEMEEEGAVIEEILFRSRFKQSLSENDTSVVDLLL